MKSFIVSIAVLLFAFFIGCQESSVTDPLSPTASENENYSQQDISKNLPSPPNISNLGLIQISEMLTLPNQGINAKFLFELEGVVKYSHQLIGSDENEPHYKYKVLLMLHINAELRNRYGNEDVVWLIEDVSTQTVRFQEKTGKELVKVYYIKGNENFKLVCEFRVTAERVFLTKCSLKDTDKQAEPIVNVL